MKLLGKLFSIIFINLIKIYQNIISPLTMASCRYTPTCSEYGLQAIKKHGPWLGGWYALKRISSCHPWGGDGHDPIP